MKGGRILQRARQRDLGSRMFVYHRLGDIVFRLGMCTPMFASHPVVLSPLLRSDAATLVPLQRHLLRVNGFPVRERVEPLPSLRGGLIPTSSNHVRDLVITTGHVVAPFATLQRFQRVLVPAVKRKHPGMQVEKIN